MVEGPPLEEECFVCKLGTMRRVWTAPHVHVAAGKFVGKFGVYKNDKRTNRLREENWNPPDDGKAKVNIAGREVDTLTSEQAKAMRAAPPRKAKKERPR